MDAWIEITDASQLAALAATRGTPEERLRAQAELVRWVLDTMPLERFDADATAIHARTVAAVTRAGAGGDFAGNDAFDRWTRSQTTDWATRQALDEVCTAVARMLRPQWCDLRPGESDLAATVEEIVHAVGMWGWDELLSEAVDVGGDSPEYHAMVDARDRAEAAAHAALCALLRKALP